MLAGGTDAGYRAILAGPHHPLSYIQIWRGGVRLDTYGDLGVPFISGAVSATLNSQVTRQLSLSVSGDFWPVTEDPTELFNPYGNEIRAWYGVMSGNSTLRYVWQVFRGQINTVSLEDDGQVLVNCVDRAAAVKEVGFIRPENSQVGTTVVAEYRRLVSDALPDATFGTFDNIFTITPQLTWDEDRGGACDDLADAAGAFWFALANGDFVLRFIPWIINQTPVITLLDGEGGTLVSAVPSKSRDNVFNQLTIVGERLDGGDPVFATAQDMTSSSPTVTSGPFGIRSKLISLQGIKTQSQCLSLARSALKMSKSLTQQWDVQSIPDAALELGDTVTISARGLPDVTQVVSSFTLSLLGDTSMPIQLRALQPGQDLGSSG